MQKLIWKGAYVASSITDVLCLHVWLCGETYYHHVGQSIPNHVIITTLSFKQLEPIFVIITIISMPYFILLKKKTQMDRIPKSIKQLWIHHHSNSSM